MGYTHKRNVSHIYNNIILIWDAGGNVPIRIFRLMCNAFFIIYICRRLFIQLSHVHSACASDSFAAANEKSLENYYKMKLFNEKCARWSKKTIKLWRAEQKKTKKVFHIPDSHLSTIRVVDRLPQFSFLLYRERKNSGCIHFVFSHRWRRLQNFFLPATSLTKNSVITEQTNKQTKKQYTEQNSLGYIFKNSTAMCKRTCTVSNINIAGHPSTVLRYLKQKRIKKKQIDDEENRSHWHRRGVQQFATCTFSMYILRYIICTLYYCQTVCGLQAAQCGAPLMHILTHTHTHETPKTNNNKKKWFRMLGLNNIFRVWNIQRYAL